MTENKFVSQYPVPPADYYTDGKLAGKAPPKPPARGENYSMFGRVYMTEDKLPSLEESGRKVLFDAQQKKSTELKKLNKLLLKAFFNLVDSLCSDPDPEAFRGRVDEIENILINMHYLTNTLREDQAHQNLKGLLEKQRTLRGAALNDLNQAFDKSRLILDSALQLLQKPSNEMTTITADGRHESLEEAVQRVIAAKNAPSTRPESRTAQNSEAAAKASEAARNEEAAMVREQVERIISGVSV